MLDLVYLYGIPQYITHSYATCHHHRDHTLTSPLPQDSHLRDGMAAEIVGKVKSDLSIQTLMATDFGADFGKSLHIFNANHELTSIADFAAAEAVVDATHRYKEIFYGDD
jgi:hypothetical protein